MINSGLGSGPVHGTLTTSECTRSFLVDFEKTPTVATILEAPTYPNNKGLNSWSNLLSLPATIRFKEIHIKVVKALTGTAAGTETIDLQVNHPRLGAFTDLTALPLFTLAAGTVAANTYSSRVVDPAFFNIGLTRFNGDSEKVPLRLKLSANDINKGVVEIQLVYEFSYHNYTF
jgi:hypothetical protein